MQRIADWLNELGMSEYAERFAENHIDSDVLRDLTDQDLKDSWCVVAGSPSQNAPCDFRVCAGSGCFTCHAAHADNNFLFTHLHR
jgi:SAM domain (Sterile alpha motif)